jgi:flavin-dependent dehydrogenase
VKADVVIVGAGPTGCALGGYLRKRGATVTLVEEIERPESVVGESMLPYSTEIYDDLGLDCSTYLVKHGAVFCKGGGAVRFDFSEAEDPVYPYAWQVQREIYDVQWRRVAESHGCRVVYAKATGIELPGKLHTSEGTVTGDLVVDASGRGMWMSQLLGLKRLDADLRNAAIGTRMRGVNQCAPDTPGDITICCIPRGWIWIIPFGGGVASVGVVMHKDCPVRAMGLGTLEERFRACIALSPDATRRLADAERILPFRGISDFTATSTTFSGPGFALCGDAAHFIDPVFSSGVLLGLRGAKTLAAALDGGDLAAWEADYREGAGYFRKFIDAWYNDDFMTIALAPRELQKPYFRRGITTLLAGDVWNAGHTSPRLMADRLPELAARLRASGGDVAPATPAA